MNTAIHNRPMNMNLSGGALLLTSYLLNIGALFSNISPVLKGVLLVLTALTTVMAFFNQFKTFRKNFKTLWIVVTVNHVFTALKPKKTRHRGITITKKTKDNDNIL